MTAPAPTHDATLAINGVGLYVEGRGSGAPIVCIHGAGGTKLAWTSAIDKLSRLGRVIAYDRRGCARSERPAHYDESAWLAFPDEIRGLLESNGPAILAELQGEWWLDADAAALATIRQPTLLVAAADSPSEFREPVQVLAAALPNARTALVGGGHLIDPAAPEVLAFLEEVLRRPR